MMDEPRGSRGGSADEMAGEMVVKGPSGHFPGSSGLGATWSAPVGGLLLERRPPGPASRAGYQLSRRLSRDRRSLASGHGPDDDTAKDGRKYRWSPALDHLTVEGRPLGY